MNKLFLYILLFFPFVSQAELLLQSFSAPKYYRNSLLQKTVTVGGKIFNLVDNKVEPVIERTGTIIISIKKIPGLIGSVPSAADPAKTYAFRFKVENGYLKVFRNTKSEKLEELEPIAESFKTNFISYTMNLDKNNEFFKIKYDENQTIILDITSDGIKTATFKFTYID